MNSIFEFSISKSGYMTIFMKISEKNVFAHIVEHFDQSRQKWRWKWQNMGNWVQFLNSLYQKRLCGNFHENPRKSFLTHRGKNKNEDEKIWKNEFDFWISISKLGCIDLFIKIWEKIIFFEIFNWERHTRTEVSKGFNTASIVSLENNIMLK